MATGARPRLSNGSDPNFRPSRSSRAPILNPYDQFPQSEFDAWIGDLTGALKRALGYHDAPPSLEPSLDFSRPSSVDVNDLEQLSPADESSYSEVDDSFAEIRERRAVNKGKARDPDEGPGFGSGIGNKDQPIEIDLDSDVEEEREDEEYEEYYGGGEEEDEQEEVEDEIEIEEEQRSWDEEDSNEDLSPPVNYESDTEARRLQVHRGVVEAGDVEEEYEKHASPLSDAEEDRLQPNFHDEIEGNDEIFELSSGSDQSEQGDEQKADSRAARPQRDRQSLSPRLEDPGLRQQDYSQGERYEDEEEDDQKEEATEESEVDEIASSDDDKQPEAEDTTFPPAPRSPAELEYPIDLPDPWCGPQTYAEDLYTGGDISPGSKDPNQLGFEVADAPTESVDRGEAPIPEATKVPTEDKPVPIPMEQDNYPSEAAETAEKVEHIFSPAHDEGIPSAADSQGDLAESHDIASGELQATSTIHSDAGESSFAVHDAASGLPTDIGSSPASDFPVVDVPADNDAVNRVFEAPASVASIEVTPNENTEEQRTAQTDTVPEEADSLPPLEVSPTQDIGEWIFGSLPSAPLSFEVVPTPAPPEAVSFHTVDNFELASSPVPPDAIFSSTPPHTSHVFDDSVQDSSTRPSAEDSLHVVELSQSFDQNAGPISDNDLPFDQPSGIFDLYDIPQAIIEEPLSESLHSVIDDEEIRDTGEQPPDNTDMQVSPAIDIEEIRDSASPHIIDVNVNMQVSEEITSEGDSKCDFEVTSPPVATNLSQSPTLVSRPPISLSEGKGEPQEPFAVEDLGPVVEHSMLKISPSSPGQSRQPDQDHFVEELAADFLLDSKAASGEQPVAEGKQISHVDSGMPTETRDEDGHIDAPAPDPNEDLTQVNGQDSAFTVAKSDAGQRSEGNDIPPHDFQPMTMRLARKATDPILLADPYPASLSTPLDYADIAKDMQEEGSSDETDPDTSMASSSTAEKDMDDGSAMEGKNDESSNVALGQGSDREDSIANQAITITETRHDMHSLMDGHDLDQDADGELDPDFMEHSLPADAARRGESPTAVPPKELAAAEPVSLGAEAPPPEKVSSPPCAVASDESNGAEANSSPRQNDVFAPSVKDNSAELPAILIIKRIRESNTDEVSSPVRQRSDVFSPTSRLPRPSKRKRSKSPSEPPVMTRSMTSRVAGTNGSAPSSSRTRSSDKQDKIQKGIPAKRSASLRSSAAKKPDSTSSSGASTASKMLRPGSRSTSRASSVSSSVLSDQPSFTMQPSPTPAPIQPQPSLFHTHSHARPLHHNHHRALPPPPIQTQLQARKSSPSNPSITESSPTTQMMPSFPAPKPLGYSPVTRSHCRYHKISLPKEEDGPRVYFLVPGCSLGDRELMEEEKIEDHGHASFEDSSRVVRDLGLLDLSPYLIGILRQLVGVDLLREQEIYYLPQPGENHDVLRPKTASEKFSLVRIPSKGVPNYEHGSLRGSPSISHASIVSPTSSRPPPSAAESASTTASTVRKSSGNDMESLSVLSDTDAGRSDDEVNSGSASTLGRPLTANQVEPGVRSDRVPLRPRRSKRLESDAAACKPQESEGVTNSEDDGMGPSRSRKRSFRRGVKRSRKADSAREEDENRTTKKLKTRTGGRSSVSGKDDNT